MNVLQIQNNIVWNCANNNLPYFGAGFTASNYINSGNIIADPLFVDPNNGDYHLQAGSPGIIKGVDVNIDTDFAGNAVASVPSIGVYEYGAAAPPPAGAANTLLDNILACWGLNETSGTTLTDVVGGYNGLLQTGAVLNSTGLVGKAVDFTAATADIKVNKIQLSGSTIAVSILFKLDVLPSTAGHDMILVKCVEDAAPYQSLIVKLTTTDKIYFRVANTTPTSFTATTADNAVAVDTWYHVVCVVNGAGSPLKIYKNKVSVETSTVNFSGTFFQITGNYFTVFGNGFWNNAEGNGLDGLLDEVGLWSTLSVAEITLLNDFYVAETGYPFGN